jgi:hypothetical protein
VWSPEFKSQYHQDTKTNKTKKPKMKTVWPEKEHIHVVEKEGVIIKETKIIEKKSSI